jgi:spermidine synthase
VKRPAACPSCGRIGGASQVDDEVKCDHCYAASKRDLTVLKIIDGLQRVVITQGERGFQLFINGNLQFSSSDEFIYHEAIVHPAICWCEGSTVGRVAILGGGDGLAAREILRYPSIRSVIVIDYDPVVTTLASEDEAFRKLNENAFSDPRLRLINRDAVEWLNSDDTLFDVIIVDFPDPQRPEYAELYTRSVFSAISRRLAPLGQFVVQATSRRHCPRTFWCLVRTIEAAGFITVKYDVAMRSFGDWSFILGRKTTKRRRSPHLLPPGLRSLTNDQMSKLPLVNLAAEMVLENESNSGVLFRYFDEEWRRWVSTLQQGHVV